MTGRVQRNSVPLAGLGGAQGDPVRPTLERKGEGHGDWKGMGGSQSGAQLTSRDLSFRKEKTEGFQFCGMEGARRDVAERWDVFLS